MAGNSAYDLECMMDDKPKTKIKVKGTEIEATLTKERQITRGKYKGTVERTFVDDDGGEYVRYGDNHLEWKDYEKVHSGNLAPAPNPTPDPEVTRVESSAEPAKEPVDLKTLSNPDIRELAQMKDGGTYLDSKKRVWGRIGDRFTVASGEGDDAKIMDSVPRAAIIKLRKDINNPPMKGGKAKR